MNSLDLFNLAVQKHLEDLYIDDKKVPVIYANPEGEFQVKERPSIVIMRSGLVLDTTRWSNDIGKVTTEYSPLGVPLKGKYVEYAHPYNLYYTVRAYGEYQQDVTTMIMHILTRLPRSTYLTVGNLKYDIFYETNTGSLSQDPNIEGDKQNKRGFVEQLMYKMEIVLDLNKSKDFTYTQTKPEFNSKVNE